MNSDTDMIFIPGEEVRILEMERDRRLSDLRMRYEDDRIDLERWYAQERYDIDLWFVGELEPGDE